MTQVVWVAIVPLKYEVMAVANTEQAAIQLAGRRALKELRRWGATDCDTNTAAKIIEYYGVTATRVPVGSTSIIGCD